MPYFFPRFSSEVALLSDVLIPLAPPVKSFSGFSGFFAISVKSGFPVEPPAVSSKIVYANSPSESCS